MIVTCHPCREPIFKEAATAIAPAPLVLLDLPTAPHKKASSKIPADLQKDWISGLVAEMPDQFSRCRDPVIREHA
eukprot:jgi/Botrbrau1/11615/Bobra.0209s0006.1